jgi:3',5'-cyclic AMP phosphodiesterase CpdA
MTDLEHDYSEHGELACYEIPDHFRMPAAPVRGVIWHFSDLEFPPGGAKFIDKKATPHGVEITHYPPYDVLLDYVGRRERWKGGILVVSGDFISGSAVERAVSKKDGDPAAARAKYRRDAFKHATDFIEQLAARLTRAGEAGVVVVVCPGNQDVDLHAAAGDDPGEPLWAYEEAVKGHVQPGKGAYKEYLGACMLALDTTRLTGSVFQLPRRIGGGGRRRYDVQLDGSLYDADEIAGALGRLRAEGTAERVEKGELLGIVVAHHPPSITPSPWLEVKPFETAVGAGQAKQTLARSGFRVFLHGHKHTAVIHEEAIFPGYPEPSDRILVLGAPAFLAAGGDDRGFSVVEFLVSPESGEARVLVHPHSLRGREQPHALPARRFLLPPRVRVPAGVIRMSASIDNHGDCRLDTEYLEIPLPPEPTLDHWGGWKRGHKGWSRRFERSVVSDLDTASKPMVRSLCPDVDADLESLPPTAERRANRNYAIKVTAGQTATHASFLERVFLPCACAVSIAHQQRVTGTASRIPGVGNGWEGVMHVLREPTRRLELVVELPFPLKDNPVMDVRAYVEQNGKLEEDPVLLDFSPPHPAANFAARRICVSFENPVVGVAYVIRWRLPAEDPLTPRDDPDGLHPYLERAEACRAGALQRNAEGMHHWLADIVSRILGGHAQRVGTPRLSELDWSLYVLDRPLAGMEAVGARPRLVAVAASRKIEEGWAWWEAGQGVAGRVYARKEVVREFPRRASHSGKGDIADEWARTGIDAYEMTGDTVGAHQVLYGIPVFAPASSHWMWGVFCIGSSRTTPRLDLDVEIPRNGPDSPATALDALRKELEYFSMWLAGV